MCKIVEMRHVLFTKRIFHEHIFDRMTRDQLKVFVWGQSIRDSHCVKDNLGCFLLQGKLLLKVLVPLDSQVGSQIDLKKLRMHESTHESLC